MRQRQRPTAETAIFDELLDAAVIAFGELDAALHVGELPHVEMAVIGDLAPAQENIGRAPRQTLTEDHATPLVVELQLVVDIGLQDRLLRLLDLQEQRIVVVDAPQQTTSVHADAMPDAHHLAGRIHDAIARQQDASRSIGSESTCERASGRALR